MGEFYTSMSRGHAIAVLVSLRSGTKGFNELKPTVNSTQTLQRLLREMESDGLITIVLKRDGHKHYDISLTEIGEEASDMLLMAAMLVSKENPGEVSLDMNHADPILRLILARGQVNMRDVMDVTRSFNSSKRVLSKMVEEGLVVCSEGTEGHAQWE